MKTTRLLFVSLVALPAFAAVRPAAVFTDGAVLQANRPVPVWGMADPGEKVVVKFAGQTKTAKAGADGKWRVALDPMAYSSVGRELVVGSTKFSDVLVGEVWLGIGQSNMEFSFDICEEGKVASKGGVIPTTVRYFHLPKDGDEKPRDMFAVPEGVKWRAYTKENEKENKRSSMLLALFAQRLSAALDVPIGVIGAAVGGANLETWMSEAAIAEAGTQEEAAKLLKMCEGWHQNDIKRWENRPESEKNRPFPKINYESRPTQVWNAMVPPLAPYAVRGIIWYCWSQVGGGPRGVGIHDKPEAKARYREVLADLRAVMPGLTSPVRRPFEEGAIHGIVLGAPNAGGRRYLLLVNTADQKVEADFAVPELARVKSVFLPCDKKVEKKGKDGKAVKDKNGEPVLVEDTRPLEGGRVRHVFEPYSTLVYRW